MIDDRDARIVAKVLHGLADAPRYASTGDPHRCAALRRRIDAFVSAPEARDAGEFDVELYAVLDPRGALLHSTIRYQVEPAWCAALEYVPTDDRPTSLHEQVPLAVERGYRLVRLTGRLRAEVLRQ